MLSNEFLLIISCILIILSLFTPFLNGFIRRPRKSSGEDEQICTPPVSIILIANDNAQELERNLQSYLSQDYPQSYEVIVVIEKSEDDTRDILKRYQDYPNLYVTFVPESSRYVSRRKLAITIGVKAARNEWLMLTEISARPNSSKWLARMARNCSENNNIVYGYSNYSAESPALLRFRRLHEEYYILHSAERHTAYRSGSNNLMFRKSEFLKERGFEGNLLYIGGEYDFIVNKYARRNSVATETSPESFIVNDTPSKKTWRNRSIFYMETRRHLKNSFVPRFLYATDMMMMHICYMCNIASLIFSIITNCWLLTITAGICLIVSMTLRAIIASKAVKRFNTGISSWQLPFLEYANSVTDLTYSIRYWCSDKNNYIAHKI